MARIALCFSAIAVAGQTQVPRIKDGWVNDDGKVELMLADGRHVRPPAEKEQAGAESLQFNASRTMAGWLVTYNGLGASYAIATEMVIYRPGKPLKRFGNGLMLIDWSFEHDDRRVRFSSSQTHGPGANWHTVEVHDIETDRLIEKYTEPVADFIWDEVKLIRVRGVVTDEKGKVLADTLVTLVHGSEPRQFKIGPFTGPTNAGMSSADGRFSLPYLQPDQYLMRLEHAGFPTKTVEVNVGPDNEVMDVGTLKLSKNRV